MLHLLLYVIYLSFISLGLPDALLGSAWPSIYGEFDVPISYAGVISMVIALGTVLSSLNSDRLARTLGTGKLTAISVAITALALFGFSISRSFPLLFLWAIPYGLGAGSVDAALNNYVALHYASRHMSWLHCMWGIGASIGPYVMGYALTTGSGWNMGYRWIALLQAALTVILFISLPLWKSSTGAAAPFGQAQAAKPLTLRQVMQLSGVKTCMVLFFCYCALEHTAGLWASSYLTLHKEIAPNTAAWFASMFFMGITAGRAASGFLTIRLNDGQMVRLGQGIAAMGLLLVFFPLGRFAALAGLTLIGLGCAPIYPSLIHATPSYFGIENSQAIIGVQMASAQTGICLVPPLFGLIANHISASLFPVFLFVLLAVMMIMHEKLLRHKAGIKNYRSGK